MNQLEIKSKKFQQSILVFVVVFFQSNFIEKLIALSFLHLLVLTFFFLLLFQIKNKRESNKYLETFICIYVYRYGVKRPNSGAKATKSLKYECKDKLEK